MYDRFLIAQLESGLDTSLKPWKIPDDAFERLNNAYVFRGRVKKRFGSEFTGKGASSYATEQLNSRLKINIGTTDPVTGVLNGNAPGNIGKIGQMFSIEDEMLTVYQANGNMLNTDPTGITVFTYNTATRAYQITAPGHLGKVVYFYPSEPVMGLTLYEDGPINNRTAYAYDTQFVYKYSGNAWIMDSTTPTFHGSNSDFFWTTNWRGANVTTTVMFTCNFNVTIGTPGANDDPMYYFNGTTWASFTPVSVLAGGTLTADTKVVDAKIIVYFKDRLLLLNVVEQETTTGPVITNKQYPNRCRFSHNGSPLDTNAFIEPNQTNADGGGYIDASTQEEIISAQIIRDRLIVFFERSTRELVYSGNEEQPFYWQKLNTELGSEGSFSTIPFDKDLLTVGSTGIHACNGVDVYRIDEKIPDEVFKIGNLDDSVKRIHGIRDFDSEMVYWTFPTGEFSFPDRILVYNYKNRSWAFNDDTFTCFGYFEQQSGLTWAEATETWDQYTRAWNSGLNREQHRRVIAGNQQGFIVKLDAELTSNASSMQISNFTTNAAGYTELTIVDNTLAQDDYIHIENASGITFINGDGIYKVLSVSSNVVTIDLLHTGTYTGGGTASFVSVIDIISKRWNPYEKDGSSVYIPKIDFNVDRTYAGEITVDYSTSFSDLPLIDESINSSSILGNNVLYTKIHDLDSFERYQDRFWHTVYFQAEGSTVQIRLYMSDSQVRDPDKVYSDFELNGLLLYASRVGRKI